MNFFEPINRNTRILDVINHPAFEGKGRLIFPWDDMKRYSSSMTMEDAPALHLWHSHMDVNQMVAGINRMISDRNKGLKILYDIYSTHDINEDSTKKNTGLFFYRGKPNAPFVVVVPGGGYSYVGSLHEGFPIAMEFNKNGYNAFVLNYRVNLGYGRNSKAAGDDLIQAVNYIIENSKQLKVASKNYALLGGSAGARTISNVTYGEAGFEKILKPALTILAYTSFSGQPDFQQSDPPAYIIGGKRDWIVPVEAIENRAKRIKAAGIPIIKKIVDIEHGFAVGSETKAEGWLNQAIKFWENQME